MNTFDFITADFHFGDERMGVLQRTASNASAFYILYKYNHNCLVTPTDKVLVIGDVVGSNALNAIWWLDRIKELNGIKTLIRGNHERQFTDEQLKPYFETIIPEGEGIELECGETQCYANHYPTKGRADRFNLCAHVHNAWQVQKNALNVGVDVCGYRPLPVEKVPFFLTAITSYYDQDVWVAEHPSNMAHKERGKKGSYLDLLKR